MGRLAKNAKLTVYVPGIDLYAHHAEAGPDPARRDYLREVVDPELRELGEDLAERGALDSRWVVVTSDHGHTDVVHDDAHALWTEGPDEPPWPAVIASPASSEPWSETCSAILRASRR